MNKLVSKNPIQRFKEGKKIIKAEDGWRLLNGKAVQRNVNNAYAARQSGDKKLTHRYIINGKQYGSFDGGKTYYGLNDGGRPLSYKANQQVLASIGRRNNPKVVDTPGSTGNKSKGTGNTLFYQFGKMGGWNNSIGIGNINDQESRNMLKEMGLSGSAQDIQNKINEEFGSNAVKADNKWGDQSKTGLKALYKKWKENQNVVPEPIVKYTSTINPTYTPPINQEVANLNLNVPQQTYDRTGVREFIRNKGINPYSFNGAQRRALRMVLNNTADDNDKLLVKGMGLFKQGGQLISRNPIERFKSNFR